MAGRLSSGEGKGIRLTGRDTLDTATTRKTTDGRLGYALDVVTKNLSVALGSAFAEALSTFSAWRHVSMLLVDDEETTMGGSDKGGRYSRPVMLMVWKW